MIKLIRGVNDLATVNPELASEWNYVRNGDLQPSDVTIGSNRKVWWLGKCGHEWDTTVGTRSGDENHRCGCPYCSNKRVLAGFNDLATTHPEIAVEWNYEKNGDLKPTDISYGSNKKVWWLLPYDVPEDYPIEHLRGKHFDFEWYTSVASRVKAGCPYLSNRKLWVGFNDLATTYPMIAAQWHPTKNGSLTPSDIMGCTNKKVWWLLPYDVPDDYPVEHLRGKHFDFEWQAFIHTRTSQNQGCPYLTGNSVYNGFNDLTTVDPILAAEWNYDKNGDLKPVDVTACSGLYVWWVLPYDVPDDYPIEHLRGKHFDFEWCSTVVHRHNGAACPYLTSAAVWPGFNDLETAYPELAKEWHPTKNGDLKPTDVSYGSSKKVWWLLPYDVPDDYPVESLRGKHFDFEWQANVDLRARGSSCPYLSGHKVWKGFNDLETLYPLVASEWHPDKNGDLKPCDFTCHSGVKVWWQVQYVNEETGDIRLLDWQSTIADRINDGNRIRNCPYLYPQNRLLLGFNDLATTHPEIAVEWNYEKNGDLKPTDVTAYSHERVWWITKIKDKTTGDWIDYEWQTQVNNRRLGRGFPLFGDSSGERYVHRYLASKNLDFVHEKTFDDLIGLGCGHLSYDFYLKAYGILIEYQGRQHYCAVEMFGGDVQLEIQQEHDRSKRKYAKEHGYALVEVLYKYNTYEKVAKYLDEHLLPLLDELGVCERMVC